MGTILTVHGTFAHLSVPGESGDSGDSASSTAYWWRADSPFVKELRSLVRCGDGEAEVKPFIWSGNNSESDRRAGGRKLLREMQALEGQGKSYCVVAHSHGGSVVSAALLQAAARKQMLPGLKRWITVGTPFVELRRERFLFTRLPILLKAVYVASLMLLVFFIGDTIGRMWDGDIRIDERRDIIRLAFGMLFASLPALVFVLVAFFRERRQRFFNRPSVRERARTYFADRWVFLTHEDDEVVRGLTKLRSVKVPIFDRQFAVPAFSLMAVFMLPALYLIAINSPKAMVSLTDLLRNRVYQLDELESQVASYRVATRSVRSIRGDMRDARKVAEDTLQPLDQREAATRVIRQRQRALRDERARLDARYPNLAKVQRAYRFKRKFLENSDGQTCNNGKLCNDGHSLPLNAKLLQHVITDEVISLFVDDDVRRGTVGRIASYLVPVVLMSLLFGLLAILWVLIVQVIARWISMLASRWLDSITWAQIKRTAVGNDTEDEIVVGTAPFPHWAGEGKPYLAMALSDQITRSSNEATFESLGKFRSALSEIAISKSEGREADNLLAYVNWNELIHTSYFVVPSFTRLVALSIARTGAFEPSDELTEAEDLADHDAWLAKASIVRKAVA